jgi:hypothetical protein
MGEIKETLCEIGLENSIVFENPDYESAIVGFDYNSDRVIYDYDKMVEFLVTTHSMASEEAVEFIDVNTIRSLSYMGEKGPIILKTIQDYL